MEYDIDILKQHLLHNYPTVFYNYTDYRNLSDFVIRTVIKHTYLGALTKTRSKCVVS